MSWNADLEIEGRPLPPGASAPRVVWRVVAGDYLGAMGMRVVQGRALGAADDSAATRAVVITDVTAHRFWPGESPIGRRIRAGNATRRQWATVVGVVRAVHSAGLDAEPGNELFVAMAQRPQSQLHLVVRAARDGSRAAAELMPALRAQVRAVDPTATISAVRSLDALVDASVAGRRAVMALLVAFAGLGLTLGMVGVYGVVAYATEQRTREIGIRTALGARPATVVALVLGHGARLAAAGVALGLLGALAASRALGALVYGVSTTDPLTYASLALLVVAVTLAASWVPARRAATGDPLAALRSEG
jgi:predicted permease